MKKNWIFGSLTALVLCATACDPKEDDGNGADGATSGTTPDDDDASATEGPELPEDDEDPQDGTTTTGEDTADDEGDTEDECSFLDCDSDSDDTTTTAECSLWDQDCGDGDKCMPWANDGGNAWNSARCTPLDSLPGQPGDACTVEGSGVTGIDSCDTGSMCWAVDEKNVGTCAPLCTGTQAAPLCDDISTTCIIANQGFLPLCLPACDPLSQNCQDGEACYPSENGFVCAPDASGPELGAYGDPCEFTNACDPSLLCAGAGAVPGCDSARCCTSYCDLTEAEPSADCEGVAGGQECVPAFAEGEVLPGYEDVGFCAIPD
ncbi:MAG: ribulose phosphate epimerase [Nannocystaceae bacterium]|nr:ribulose phosphate epimerase [Nannocystaceae bacterium]